MQNDVEAQQGMLPPPDQTLARQAFLFSSQAIEAVKREEKAAGRYTAAELKDEKPAIYQAVIEQLAAGTGLLRIARMFGIHHRTAAAVRDAEPESIDIVRSKMVARLTTAADLQVERLIENPGSVPFNVAGLVVSQLLDKAELLAGRATARVESVERLNIHDDYEAFIRSNLPSEKQANAREIGSEGGEIFAIEAAAAGAPRELAAADQERCSDVESAVYGVPATVVAVADTASAADCSAAAGDPGAAAAGPDVQTGGRGGIPVGDQGVDTTIHPASQKFSGNCPSDAEPEP